MLCQIIIMSGTHSSVLLLKSFPEGEKNCLSTNGVTLLRFMVG